MSAQPPALQVEIHLPLSQFPLHCNFEAQNEVVVLFGHSGAAKTSLLDCIAGLRSPQQGRIGVGERVLFSSEQKVNVPVHQRRIGYLSQKPALFPHLSVRQNIEYGLLDLPEAERNARVDAALERFHVSGLATRRPAAISGGEQQRVALARALVREPELLLLDEPLSALDLSLKSSIIETLFEWQRERAIPMLYVTHDQSEAYSLSRRVLLLEKGRIVADGEPREVFSTPLSREQALLTGYENIYEASVVETHAEFGTMACRLAEGGVLLESPLASKRAGDPVRLALHAGDILMATERPTAISARNILQGRIESMVDRAGMIEVRVQCGSGASASFIVHITRGAQRSLALERGQTTWLIIKTHSIQLLRSE